jgi:hypothetical protein
MPRGGVVPTTVRVEGLRELLRVTDQLPKDVKRGVRNEQLFLANVSDDSRKTRYGVSVRKVGTISVEQRVKGKDRNPRRRRPKFTDLVWDKSLEPAAARNERAVMDGFNRVLDGLERRWRVG